MKAPDKLVFDEATFSDIGIFGVEGEVEYIRKDALLEWANKDLCPTAYLQLKNKVVGRPLWRR